MLMDDCYIKFQGFHPSDYTEFYLNEKMEALLDEAPYGSSLNATFTRNGREFKGVITIYSQAGKFFAVASGSKIKEVSHSLIEQIRRQLKRWKDRRFEHRSLRDLEVTNVDDGGGGSLTAS